MSWVDDLQHEYKFFLIQQFTLPKSDKTVKHRVHRSGSGATFYVILGIKILQLTALILVVGSRNVLYYIINKHAFPITYQ